MEMMASKNNERLNVIETKGRKKTFGFDIFIPDSTADVMHPKKKRFSKMTGLVFLLVYTFLVHSCVPCYKAFQIV